MAGLLRIAFIVVFCLLLGGCGPTVQFSEELTEPGEVYDTAFIPKGHGSDTAVGFSTNGDLTVTPIDIDIPERFAMIFKCQHGKFVVDSEKARDLYQRLERGDKVIIHYRTVFHVINNKRQAVDLDFLDAVKVEPETKELTDHD